MNQQLTTKSRKKISTQIKNLTSDIFLSVVLGFPLLIAGFILMQIPERYQVEVDFHSRALSTIGIVMEKKKYQSCSSYSYGYSCTPKCEMKVRFKDKTGNNTIFWDKCNVSAEKNELITVLYDPIKIIESRIFYQSDTPKNRAVGQLILSLFITGTWLLSFFPWKKNSR
jgi:hypothetical protein